MSVKCYKRFSESKTTLQSRLLLLLKKSVEVDEEAVSHDEI